MVFKSILRYRRLQIDPSTPPKKAGFFILKTTNPQKSSPQPIILYGKIYFLLGTHTIFTISPLSIYKTIVIKV